MKKTDIVTTLLKKLESSQSKSLAQSFTDDFIFSGPVPEPLDRGEFLGLMEALRLGIPDWSFNAREVREEGDYVTVQVQITGTHTARLALPGLPPVPATGKKFKIPPETIRCMLECDRVAEIKVNKVPGGGVPGILQQLGVRMPEEALA